MNFAIVSVLFAVSAVRAAPQGYSYSYTSSFPSFNGGNNGAIGLTSSMGDNGYSMDSSTGSFGGAYDGSNSWTGSVDGGFDGSSD